MIELVPLQEEEETLEISLSVYAEMGPCDSTAVRQGSHLQARKRDLTRSKP